MVCESKAISHLILLVDVLTRDIALRPIVTDVEVLGRIVKVLSRLTNGEIRLRDDVATAHLCGARPEQLTEFGGI